MKQKPITFVQKYSDHDDDSTRKGFEPYRLIEDEYVHSLNVEIVAEKWNYGSILILNIYECIGSSIKRIPIHTKYVYTNHSYHESDIVPTTEQALMIEALSSGDLRGKYAENIANSLYIDLFVLNPKGGMKEFLPNIVDFYQKLKTNSVDISY